MKRIPKAQRPSWARRVVIFCNRSSCEAHKTEDIGVLESFSDGGAEIWKVLSCTEQRSLVHVEDQDVDPDYLERNGMVAHHFKFKCFHCGYDVSASEQFGMDPRGMAFQRVRRQGSRHAVGVPPMSEVDPMHAFAEESVYYSPRRQKICSVLSDLADHGVSRLPLTALARIVAL